MPPASFPDNLSAVNPRIGTGRRGNCLIGPCLPFGTVRLGPDIAYPQPTSGYRPGKAVIGFSHTHLSGTGGSARYGNVRIMPFRGEPRRLPAAPFVTFPATGRKWSVPVEEEAEVGRYRCRFAFGVEAELSATRRVGVHRYRFDGDAAGGGTPHLLVDCAALLQNGVAPAGQAPYCEYWEMEGISRDGAVEVLNSRELAGHATFLGGWGHFEPYTVFFFVRSREPFARCGLFDAAGPVPVPAARAAGPGLRALLAYPGETREVHLEVGISLSSGEEARRAVEEESGGAGLEAIRGRARAAWTPWLDRIEVEGGTADQRALFATSLYRLFTLPTETGTTADGGPAYTDIACLWDSIRNANSLMHLVAPEFSAGLMNFLLAEAGRTGWLPDAHIAGHFAYQQSGCSAEILFSEAARKGVPGVDYRRALAACVRNAETRSDDPSLYGRYGADDAERLGYLTTRVDRGCVSRHVEYACQDWCIARLAGHLGEAAVAERFDARARRLWNLWREEERSFWPRGPDGSWADRPGAGPDHLAVDSWNDPHSYEGSLRHWSFNVLQDIGGLVSRCGGPASFVDFLDRFFAGDGRVEKETRMHIPHLYAFAGRPDLAAAAVAKSLARYGNSADGIPDDEDMGCHSAYYICNAVGLYPLYGLTCYSLVPPLFDEARLRYGETGRSLTIRRRGAGKAIREARINGAVVPGTLLEHREIAGGGLLEIELG